MEQKRILITGANGLIGSALYKLLKKEYLVTGIDNNFRKGNKPSNNIIIQNAKDFFYSNENNFDYVFHLSAINGTNNFYEIPNSVIQNNIECDLAAFKFAEKNPSSKLIYASSSEVIADCDKVPTQETAEVKIQNIHNPRWSYRIAKIVAENYLFNSDINFLIVRFFNVFSENSRPGHFVHDIKDKITKNDFNLIGGNETRSFCYIDDAIDALVYLMDKANNDIINVGNSEEITILQAANIIAQELYNKEINWISVNGQKGSTKRRCPDITKLKNIFPDYNPITFKHAIEKIREKTNAPDQI